jgi:hypothetical protein
MGHASHFLRTRSTPSKPANVAIVAIRLVCSGYGQNLGSECSGFGLIASSWSLTILSIHVVAWHFHRVVHSEERPLIAFIKLSGLAVIIVLKF